MKLLLLLLPQWKMSRLLPVNVSLLLGWCLCVMPLLSPQATTQAQDTFTIGSGEDEIFSTPTYTLEPLNFSVSYRQNVCDRQAAFHAGNVSLRNALQGLELRPYFVTDIQNFSPTDANGTIPLNSKEPSIRILDELAKRAGFTWRNSYGASSFNDALSVTEQTREGQTRLNRYQVNFDNIVNWAVQSYDLAGNEFSKTLTRVANGSSFIEGHVDASIIMVGKKDEEAPKVDLFSFLAPFDWQVWLLTLFTMTVAGLVYQWMEWLNEDSDALDLQNKPTETIYFAMLSFNGDIKFQPSTNYARVFVLILAFWGLILSSAYTANLASFLVIQNTPVLQVETLGEAVAAFLPLCVVQGTSQEFEVLNSYPQARLVSVPATNPNQIFTNVLQGRCKLAVAPLFLWDSARRNRTINRGCRLRWVGRTFKFVRSGFAARSDSGTFCTNLIRDVLSVHIGEMNDDGTLDTIYRQYFRSIQTLDCNRADDTIVALDDETIDDDVGPTDGASSDEDPEYVQSLSLQDIGGLFIVIYCVGFLSCIAAIVTWYRKARKKRVELAQNSIHRHDLELKEEIQGNFADMEQRQVDKEHDGNTSDESCAGREELLSKLSKMRQDLDDLQSIVSKKIPP